MKCLLCLRGQNTQRLVTHCYKTVNFMGKTHLFVFLDEVRRVTGGKLLVGLSTSLTRLQDARTPAHNTRLAPSHSHSILLISPCCSQVSRRNINETFPSQSRQKFHCICDGNLEAEILHTKLISIIHWKLIRC